MRRKIGKIKDGKGLYGTRYRITVDGVPTDFNVEKSVPPRYMMPQMWDVFEGDDPQMILFDGHSLFNCLEVFDRVVNIGEPEA